jgi:hypothetical protein
LCVKVTGLGNISDLHSYVKWRQVHVGCWRLH